MIQKEVPYNKISITAELLDELTAIVSRASATIITLAKSASEPQLKSDQSPVTAADRAAEELILDGLAALCPGVPVIAEEAAGRGLVGHQGREYFLIDPLDGTREFIGGRPEFTVNIALIRAGVPVLGIIAAPAIGTFWRTLGDYGAERITLSPGASVVHATDRIPLRTRRWPARGAVAMLSRSHFDAASCAFLDRLPPLKRIACGSSLKFCRIAEGAADLYPRLGPTTDWDVAAGHAILVASGGLLTTPDGAPLRYGRPDGLVIPGFVAWGDRSAAARHTR